MKLFETSWLKDNKNGSYSFRNFELCKDEIDKFFGLKDVSKIKLILYDIPGKNRWEIQLKSQGNSTMDWQYVRIKGTWEFLMTGTGQILCKHLELSLEPVYAYVECYVEDK